MVETNTLAEGCSCAALRQAARHLTRLYDDALSPVELGLNQYSILAKLDFHGPQILQDLAARLVMDRSTLGHLLRPLQARELVSIGPAPTDRRARLISLTPEGKALRKRARPLWSKAEQKFLASFGNEEALTLRTMLKRVTLTPLDAA